MKADASIQPGCLQDLMLHETAKAWVLDRLKKTVPKVAWEETVEEYGERLKQVAAHIERKYNVDGLCRELPDRVADLHKRRGDRIPKSNARSALDGLVLDRSFKKRHAVTMYRHLPMPAH